MEERMKQLESQVGTLNAKNLVQEKEMAEVKKIMENYATIKMADSASNPKNSVESFVTVEETSAGSCSGTNSISLPLCLYIIPLC